MGLGDSKLGFWEEKWDFRDSQLSQLATACKLAREASNVVTESHVFLPRRARLLATASNVVTGSMSRPPRRATWRQRGYSARHGELVCLGGELPQFQFFCSAFCVLFTRFYFELTFGINMKVLEDCISFPMALS